MARYSAARDFGDRLGVKLALVWAGLSIGVAFVATPAKFLAPSLSLPVALDVGRQTFAVYGAAELALLLTLVIVGALSKARLCWALALAVPGAIVVGQSLWLLPALDLRVAAILADAPPVPPSSLHTLYIVAEALKVLALLGAGLAGSFLIPGSTPMRSRRRFFATP